GGGPCGRGGPRARVFREPGRGVPCRRAVRRRPVTPVAPDIGRPVVDVGGQGRLGNVHRRGGRRSGRSRARRRAEAPIAGQIRRTGVGAGAAGRRRIRRVTTRRIAASGV